MARFGLLSLAFAFVATIAATALTADAADSPPCHRTKFETKLVKDACAAGGQKAAKDAMKKFLKEAKKKNASADCKTCHEKLAPNYETKKDALKHFKEYGGE